MQQFSAWLRVLEHGHHFCCDFQTEETHTLNLISEWLKNSFLYGYLPKSGPTEPVPLVAMAGPTFELGRIIFFLI